MFEATHLRSARSARRNGTRSNRPSGPALLVLGAMFSAIAAIALPMGAASATSARISPAAVAAPRTSTFCLYAANAAKSSNTSSAATQKAPSLQQAYAKLKAEEPVILAQAPSQIRGDFQGLFGYLNNFYSALSSVKFVVGKLPVSYYEGLAKLNIKKITADGKAIEAYVTNVCHVKA